MSNTRLFLHCIKPTDINYCDTTELTKFVPASVRIGEDGTVFSFSSAEARNAMLFEGFTTLSGEFFSSAFSIITGTILSYSYKWMHI